MGKQALTLGIVLSLGTAGCAGLGLQQSSSLSSQAQQQRGLDDLWVAPQEGPGQGFESRHYAGQGLGTLWGDEPKEEPSVVYAGTGTRRTGGDLWNPASVARSWEVSESTHSIEPSRSLTMGATARGKRGGKQVVAH